MRKSLFITSVILLLCMCGCEATNQATSKPESNETSSMMLATTAEAESTEEPEATSQSSVDIAETVEIEKYPPTSVEAHDTNLSDEDAAHDNEEGRTSSGSEITPSFEVVETPAISLEPASEKQTEPIPTPEPPKETDEVRPTEPTAPTETPAPVETQPPAETQPKTAYDFEFDINAIRADCIAIGQSMGYTLNTALTPQNATWWNPVTASESNQGSALRSSLEQYIRFHTVTNLGAYGLDEINEFNICCDSQGNGSYAIYFVFA